MPEPFVLQCAYHAAGRCRSCTLLGTPYDRQLADKQARAEAALAGHPVEWAAPFASRPAAFRNKAKLVAGGTRARPTLGILDGRQHGVDLSGCGLYEAGLDEVVGSLTDVVGDLGLVPYAVPARSGELKHVLVTHSPDGELMLRFVLRSHGQVGRIRRQLPDLVATYPGARVVSVNIQPAHAAVLEGPEEIVLTGDQELTMRVNGVPLRLRPRSFFQTNTAVAAGLYRQARSWVDEVDPASLWDLYCGVGGFALHTALRPDGTAREVLGIESSADAVDSARATASALGLAVRFRAADATGSLAHGDGPEMVVVNPPRRGIGPDLARRIEASGAGHVLYSSCNVASLARDIAAMPGFVPVRARVFDMFPQTEHLEVLTLLRRLP